MFEKLIKENRTVSSVESFTGGAFISKLIQTPGASKVVKGSLVAYQTELKEKHNIDTSQGVISKACAQSMCEVGEKMFGSDITISFTGNAGPTAMDDKPVGLIYIGIKSPETFKVYEFNLTHKNRQEVIEAAVDLGTKIIEML